MAFTNFHERDINEFYRGYGQLSNLGPGSYEPHSDFKLLKKRTQSRKPPAFLNGVPKEKEGAAVGSNYHNSNFYPGPGMYDTQQLFQQFGATTGSAASKGVQGKDKQEEPQYFTVTKGGRLAKRQ